jgi:hypothetical protein
MLMVVLVGPEPAATFLTGGSPMRHLGRSCGLALCGLAWLLPAGMAAAQDAQQQKRINQAIDEGVAYLRKHQGGDGQWPGSRRSGVQPTGSTTLAAWTLLESGVPASDPAIQRAATAIRQAMVNETYTYHVSLGIFFLHRLGDPQDIPLLESLAVRLLAGQNPWGGWGYNVPHGGDQDRLNDVIRNRKAGEQAKKVVLPRDAGQLTRETKQQLQVVLNQAGKGAGPGDNSNTQFAMLALWVAGKYGIPVDRALKAVEMRFRRAEHGNGSWDYMVMGMPPGKYNNFAMSAAGMIGLGLGYANDKNRSKRPELKNDPAVQAGFAYLGKAMRGQAGAFDKRHFYFLWTLERTGVAYDVKKMDGIDWYLWGATQLVGDGSPGERGWQGQDGSWHGEYADDGCGCDTCFALLFLKRVNITGVLTDPSNLAIIEDKTHVKAPKKKPKDIPIDLTPFVPKEDTKKAYKNKRTSLLDTPAPSATRPAPLCLVADRSWRARTPPLPAWRQRLAAT